MQRPLTRIVRNWFAWLMAVVLVGSLAIWFLTRPTLPGEVRIATAVPGGQYHEEGARIAEALRVRTNRKVQVLQTPGSEENANMLRAGEVDIAIVQAGSVSLEGLAVVTPLHRDVVHVIARKLSADNSAGGGAIRTISDLAGRNIIVGKNSSGMQHSAADVLDHYNLLNLVEKSSVHFTALMEDAGQGYAGAIVTTGIENEDLRRLLESGKFELIPLDAAALEKRHRHFEYYEIPSQLWPPVPDGPIPTVATSALVVVREDASSGLVKLLLDSIFEDGLPEYFSTLYTPQEARNIMPGRLHPMTRRYHDPFGRYGVLHTILEGLAAGKELLFALGAAVYLMWDRWRRIKERESQALIKEQKSRLDTYLEQTLEIERVQMDVFDPARLQQYLDEVTDIKLRALSRLTHEDLRGDRTFAIFLMQCANLISKIQLKIINCTK